MATVPPTPTSPPSKRQRTQSPMPSPIVRSTPVAPPAQSISVPSISAPLVLHPQPQPQHIQPLPTSQPQPNPPIHPPNSATLPDTPICLAPSCTAPSSRQGPDGPNTLCPRCYARYAAYNLPVYLSNSTGKPSVVPSLGAQRMRVTGFAPRGTRMRDLSQPTLEPDDTTLPPVPPPPPQRAKLATPVNPRCLRPACGTTSASQWCRGPDGPCTLCNTCYARYFSLKVVLYRSPTMDLSVIPREGWTPVKVTAFAKSSTGKSRDLTRPIVTELADSPEDVELRENDAKRLPKPIVVARRAKKRCLRMCGKVACRPGPDGPDTLCEECGELYATGGVAVYMGSDGCVTVEEGEGKIEMKVRGFEAGEEGGGDLTRPVVAPVVVNKGENEEAVSGSEVVLEEGDGNAAMQIADIVCPFIDELKKDGDGEVVVAGSGTEMKDEDGGQGRVGAGDEEGETAKKTELEIQNGKSEKQLEENGDTGEARTKKELRVRIEYNEEVKEAMVGKDTSWSEFYEGICGIWGVKGVGLSYEDDEGDFITMATASDYKEMLMMVINCESIKIRLSDGGT